MTTKTLKWATTLDYADGYDAPSVVGGTDGTLFAAYDTETGTGLARQVQTAVIAIDPNTGATTPYHPEMIGTDLDISGTIRNTYGYPASGVIDDGSKLYYTSVGGTIDLDGGKAGDHLAVPAARDGAPLAVYDRATGQNTSTFPPSTFAYPGGIDGIYDTIPGHEYIHRSESCVSGCTGATILTSLTTGQDTTINGNIIGQIGPNTFLVTSDAGYAGIDVLGYQRVTWRFGDC